MVSVLYRESPGFNKKKNGNTKKLQKFKSLEMVDYVYSDYYFYVYCLCGDCLFGWSVFFLSIDLNQGEIEVGKLWRKFSEKGISTCFLLKYLLENIFSIEHNREKSNKNRTHYSKNCLYDNKV